MANNSSTKVSACTFTEVIPYRQYKNTEGGWRDGMVTGNGHTGVVCSGSPYSETLIYQNIEFIMPSPEPRETPQEVAGELHEARQAVINFDDTWDVHGRRRTFLYCFHPGHQLRLQMRENELSGHVRQTDYETGEVSVKYHDADGTWIRKTFTSREDDVTITSIASSDKGAKINVTISIDDLASMPKFGQGHEVDLQYKKLVADDGSYIALAAHYPEFAGSELAEGGFAGVSRIVAIGGAKEKALLDDAGRDPANVGREKHPAVVVRDADAVFIITATARTHHMGRLADFAQQERYALVDQLAASLKEVEGKYTDQNGNFSYDLALASHVRKHAPLFNAVSFALESLEPGNDEGTEEGGLCSETLLSRQKESPELLAPLVERMYNQGRYVQICCGGYSAPRLCGLWTGEWNPGWRGAYTMDANVNLQVAGMNTGHVEDAAVGYIYFILRQIEDWKKNAAMVYGMQDALLVPVNTDGDRAPMVEYDQHYPFQYWNAGASWMLLPIFEFWQCFGNRPIPVAEPIRHLYKQDCLDLERDILLPLLTMQANFWEQLCTPEYYVDQDGNACFQKGKQQLLPGEKYLIIPSYSPENRPKGYNSAITANATMDISAARDGLQMAIAIEKAVAREGYEEAVAKWEDLLSKLPDYQYDHTGALKEWAVRQYEENNAHRHISHMYCAWPGYETQHDPELAEACRTAIENRNRENAGKDDTASHGWVHRALVAARLKDGEAACAMLHKLLASDICFNSLMTDHNTDRGRGVYCTDTALGIVGVINEMLAYSNTGEIELLPALPRQWARGSVRGLMARTNAEITLLEWDLEAGWIRARIRSERKQVIRISQGIGGVGADRFMGGFVTTKGERYANNGAVCFEQGEETEIRFQLRQGIG